MIHRQELSFRSYLRTAPSTCGVAAEKQLGAERSTPGAAPRICRRIKPVFARTGTRRKTLPVTDAIASGRPRRRSLKSRTEPTNLSPSASKRRSTVNDPSAGSPTETLLRLLLPLNNQVSAPSQSENLYRPTNQSRALTKTFNR